VERSYNKWFQLTLTAQLNQALHSQGKFMDKLKRYELINQLLILEKLYPEETDYYARNKKVIPPFLTVVKSRDQADRAIF